MILLAFLHVLNKFEDFKLYPTFYETYGLGQFGHKITTYLMTSITGRWMTWPPISGMPTEYETSVVPKRYRTCQIPLVIQRLVQSGGSFWQGEPADEGADERAARGQPVPYMAAPSSSRAPYSQGRGDESEGRLSPPRLDLPAEETRS